MNQKKAKLVRRVLRSRGLNERDAQYIAGVGKTKKYHTGQIDEHGKQLINKHVVTGTIRLADFCGRNMYKKLKAVYAKPTQSEQRQ